MEDDDEWVNLAMSNELLVANLLLQLRHDPLPAPPQPPPRRCTKRCSSVLSLRWSVYQPRSTKRKSRPMSTERPSKSTKRPAAADTPFSGNGGSVAAANGFDDSRHSTNPVDSSRPKVNLATRHSFEIGTASMVSRKPVLKARCYPSESISPQTIKVNKVRDRGPRFMISDSNIGRRLVLKPRFYPSESISPQTIQDNKGLDGATRLLVPDLNLPVVGEDFTSQV